MYLTFCDEYETDIHTIGKRKDKKYVKDLSRMNESQEFSKVFGPRQLLVFYK